jgi:hypothetical protein
MSTPSRRFPAPWHADNISGVYIVRDANVVWVDELGMSTCLRQTFVRKVSGPV